MKKNIYKQVFMAAAVLMTGLSASSCYYYTESKDIPEIRIPMANSITPNDGVRPGSEVTIEGKFMGEVKSVRIGPLFNLPKEDFTSVTNDKITFTLPSTAPAGRMYLVPNRTDIPTLYAGYFGVKQPVVTGITPREPQPGEDVTISGHDLDLVTRVKFSGVTLTPKDLNAAKTEMKVTIPPSQSVGILDIGTDNLEHSSVYTTLINIIL